VIVAAKLIPGGAGKIPSTPEPCWDFLSYSFAVCLLNAPEPTTTRIEIDYCDAQLPKALVTKAPRSKRDPDPQHPRPHCFADIRKDCEDRLARGLKLDFDQIMLDIDAIKAAMEIAQN
jgi:hypothetical protein